MKKIIPVFTASLLTLSCVLGTGLAYGEESGVTASGPDQEVIVVYKNQEGKEAVLDQSVEIQHEFATVPAVSATVSPADLQELVQDPNIAYVERNVPFTIADEQVIAQASAINVNEQSRWNYQAEQPNLEWDKGYTGTGIKVAVVDSGIAPHPELSIAGGVSTVDYTSSYTDDNGHGTHVGGIIAARNGDGQVTGMAPGVQLYAVKTMGADGKGNLQDVLEGVDWAIKNHMDVINMSLGTEYDSQLLHNMLDQAYNSGILVVASAGNSGAGTDTVNYPAQYSSVIAVAAVDSNLNRGSFSSTGPKVEVAAPGVDIVSTYLNNQYAIMDGTSQAAPHVAAMLAILKQQRPGATPAMLRSDLQNYAVDLGTAGRDNQYGYGFVTFKPQVDTTAPAEVKNLQLAAKGTDYLTFNWQNPADSDFAKVHVYDAQNHRVQSVTGNVYSAAGLTADTNYTFTMKTVDVKGNESAGVTISGRTAAVSTVESAPAPVSAPVNTAPTPVPAAVTPAPAPAPAVSIPVVPTPPPSDQVAQIPAGGGGGGGGGGAIPRPAAPKAQDTTPSAPAATTPAQKAQQQLNNAKSSGKASDFMKARFAAKDMNNAEFNKQLNQLKQSLGIKDLPSKANLRASVPVRISLQAALKSSTYKYIDKSSITADNVTILDDSGNAVSNVNLSVKFNRIFITAANGSFAANQTYTVIIEKGVKGKSSAAADQSTGLTNPLVMQFTTR